MKLSDLTDEPFELFYDRTEKRQQGYLVWYQKVPYPSRSYRHPQEGTLFVLRALEALGTVKKYMYALSFLFPVVLPKTLRVKKWNQFLLHLYMTFWWDVNEFFLQDDEWSQPVWEMGKLVKNFLSGLGFTDDVAVGFSKIIMCFLEFDVAYRYRLQDLLGLVRHLDRTSIGLILNVYLEREGINGAKDRITKIGKLLQYVLWLPKFKNALEKAQIGIDFRKFKLDKNDKFHIAWWKGYEFGGKGFEDRFKPYEEIYRNAPYRKRVRPEVTAQFMTE